MRFTPVGAVLLVALATGCGKTALLDPHAEGDKASLELLSVIEFGEALPGDVVRRDLEIANVSQTDATGLELTLGDALSSERPSAFDVGGTPPKVAWGKRVKIQLTFRPALPPGSHRGRLFVSWSGGLKVVELRARSGDPCKAAECPAPKDVCHASARCEAGVCTYDPKPGTPCDDANLCTLTDRCANDGVCRGEPVKCDQPPAQHCVSKSTLRTFVTPGTCATGVCGYAPKDAVCEFGCLADKCFDPCEGVVCQTPPGFCFKDQGRCVAGGCRYEPADGKACDDQQACTVGDTCQAGACKGSPMVCRAPPAAKCTDPDNSQYYEEEGACVAGTCVYAQKTELCAIACLRGRCARSCSTSLAAGTGQSGMVDGNALTSRLTTPYSMALDATGRLFINDTGNSRVRELFAGKLSTVPGSTGIGGAHDVAVDGAGGLLVGASGRILRVAGGAQSVVAGGTATGFADGPALTARFGSEVSVVGTTGQEIFVADASNQRIRRIFNGVVSTYAGGPGAGKNDGPNAFARFNHPHDLILVGGVLKVADASNALLRSVSSTETTTVAGSINGYLDGALLSSRFFNPLDVAVDAEGALYLADSGNHCIRRISPTRVSTFAGTCTLSGYREGAATSAQFNGPAGIAIASDGTFYVADTDNHRIRRITCVP